MGIKRYIFIIFLLLGSFVKSAEKIKIDTVEIECAIKNSCIDYYLKLIELKEQSLYFEEISERLKIFLLDDSIEGFKYKVIKNNKMIELKVFIIPKIRIQKIVFKDNYSLAYDKLSKVFIFKINDYYNENNKDQAVEMIKNHLKNRGYTVKDVTVIETKIANKLILNFKILISQKKIIKNVVIIGGDVDIKENAGNSFNKFKKKIWDKNKFKEEQTIFVNNLKEQGYHKAKLKYNVVLDKSNSFINLHIKIIAGDKSVFYFKGHKSFSRNNLIVSVRQYIKNNLGRFTPYELIKNLENKYEAIGMYGTNVNVRIQFAKNRNGNRYIIYYITIKEGVRVPIKKIEFNGNEQWLREELIEFYEEHASPVASRGFVDVKYFDEFTKKLKEKFVSNGFIFVEVLPYELEFDNEFRFANLKFRIKERQRTLLRKINIFNISTMLLTKIKKRLNNQESEYLNIVSFQDDLKVIVETVQEDGFFFAKIKNMDKSSLIKFSKGYTEAAININIDTGKKIIFNKIIVSGNKKTKKEVIQRELNLLKDEVVTPLKVKKLKKRLSYLGLFSYISITPDIKDESNDEGFHYSDLLIQVKERDSIKIEIAPGYRTDIGFKISAGLTKDNFLGMNRFLTFKTQANQRYDFDNFDERRRSEKKQKLEYSAQFNYNEPYLFGLPFEFDFGIYKSRKRFYSFDADISRLALGTTKIIDNFLFSLKYQLEEIKPFDASEEKDRDLFRIGSITPTIAFDLRDDKINPRKGILLQLLCEWANPTLFSKNKSDLEINYYKLISRNRFYVSLKNLTIALSISSGLQKNLVSNKYYKDSEGLLQTRGYIPSIKVFRLSGIDSVRGYDDSEINRVDMENNPDITEIIVDNTAFFSNIKLEPRYLFDKNMMVGVFIDAGKVFVNHYRPLKLRSSVGLSLKFLTPVGSLDFDYGVKTRRKSNIGQKRESFGRFHLSIGHF